MGPGKPGPLIIGGVGITIGELERVRERMGRYITGMLSSKFRCPISIDETVLRIMSVNYVNKGSDIVIWVDGNQVNLKDLHLKIVVDYQKSNIQPSKETQLMQDVG